MATASLQQVVDRLRTGSRRIGANAESDGQQLRRFLDLRDESALADLIRRHGPMVLAVCQRVLHHHADAEDAFQATFLVLVRKAHQIQPADRVGAWLHGVARRTACFAKKTRARRRESVTEMSHMSQPAQPGADMELLAALDDEIQRLPDKFRIPIVMCELEGRTIQNVAAQMSLPNGTVASRLHRGRELLAQRMKRHQAAMTASGIATLLAGSARAGLPAGLLQSTAKLGAATAIASGVVVGVSSSVAQLSEGVFKLMLLTKIKTISSAAVAVLVMVGTGMVWYSNSALADDPTTPPAAVIKSDAKKSDEKPLTKMQGLWKDLMSHDDVKQTKAVLAMAAAPKETMTFLQTELRPVKFDRAKALKWIADLGSDKEEIYQPAMKELDYIAPLIHEDLEDAMENAPNENARQRAMAIMMDMPEVLMPAAGGVGRIVVGGAAALPAVPIPAPPAPAPVIPPLPPGGAVIQIAGGPGMDEGVHRLSWKRAVRAITILEHLGTPDAIATLKKIADGETDAGPTKAAKEALQRLEKRSE